MTHDDDNGLPAPNYTQVPNFIIDEWMKKLSPAEFKVISLILRYTAGYHRRSASISFNHFEHQTGVSRKWVRKCCKKLEKLGWIRILHGDHETSNTYEILVKKEESLKNLELGYSTPQSSELKNLDLGYSTPQPRVLSTPGVGYSAPPIKKAKKEKEKKDTSPAAAAGCRLSDFLLMKIKEMDPTFKQPNLKAWVKVFSAMMDKQGRSENDIKAVITWVFNNDFWCTNILSPSKLEKQYTALFISMTKDKENPKAKQAEASKAKETLIVTNKAFAKKFIESKTFNDRRNSLILRDQHVEVMSEGKVQNLSYSENAFQERLANAYHKIQSMERRE